MYNTYNDLGVIIGFAVLTYLLIKYRRKFLERNLLLTADQIWPEFSDRAIKAHCSKEDLLFGIWQDGTGTVPMLIVKNYKNEIVGKVEFPIARLGIKISAGNEIFKVKLSLLSDWTASLSAENNTSILASYEKLNIFGKHKFEIPEYGTLIAKPQLLKPRYIFDYHLENDLVGASQEFSPIMRICKLIVLPASLPLHIRIFILALRK